MCSDLLSSLSIGKDPRSEKKGGSAAVATPRIQRPQAPGLHSLAVDLDAARFELIGDAPAAEHPPYPLHHPTELAPDRVRAIVLTSDTYRGRPQFERLRIDSPVESVRRIFRTLIWGRIGVGLAKMRNSGCH